MTEPAPSGGGCELEVPGGNGLVDRVRAQGSQPTDHFVMVHAPSILAATRHLFGPWCDVAGMENHRRVHHIVRSRSFKRTGSIVAVGLMTAGLALLPSITDADGNGNGGEAAAATAATEATGTPTATGTATRLPTTRARAQPPRS